MDWKTARLEVRKMGYYVPLQLTGVDDQGRQTCRCPQCGADAYVADDGRVVCSNWEPVQRLLADAFNKSWRVMWETPCPNREDKRHCNCWYDDKACCACGDPATDDKEEPDEMEARP